MRKLDLEQLKEQYIGKQYNRLTVIDVIRDNSIIKFICRCQCNNITTVNKTYVLSGHTTSCGCYRHSKEKSDKYKQWCKNNPDKIKEQVDKYRQWCKNNPDKVKSKTLKRKETLDNNPDIQINANNAQKQYWKDHPDELIERGRKRSQWSKDNPEKQLEINSKLHQFYIDNPDKTNGKYLKELYSKPEYISLFRNKLSDWYKQHPEQAAERRRKQLELYNKNPSIVERISKTCKQYWDTHKEDALLRGEKVSQFYKANRETILHTAEINSENYREQRSISDISCLLEIIHPSQVNDLLSGNIKSTDIIKTKCPLCSSYSEHTLHNVFIFNDGRLKNGRAPLCQNCRISLTSSHYEEEISDFISTFYDESPIRNNRNIIYPLELDLYYPNKRIAIEFNGNFWHDINHKPKNYHYDKFNICRNKDILLISIFESEWISKTNDIKLYLKDLFNDIHNNLSFNEDKTLMNNNYPSKSLTISDELIEEQITFRNTTVYTCGYSRIIK